MSEPKVSPRALALYFRKFATLIGAGVSLIRAMDIVGESTGDTQLKSVNAEMMRGIEAGETLSVQMGRFPGVFSRVALVMVRAGEVGGILDETLERLAQYLDTDIELRDRCRLYATLAGLCDPRAADAIQRRLRAALDTEGSRVNEAIFCRALGAMIGAGVPVSLALECAADAFEGQPGADLKAAAKDLTGDTTLTNALRGTGALSTVTLELCRVGEDVGQLDFMLKHAADLQETETMSALRAALMPAEPRGDTGARAV
jgi:type II secretory pathway component PulF